MILVSNSLFKIVSDNFLSFLAMINNVGHISNLDRIFYFYPL